MVYLKVYQAVTNAMKKNKIEKSCKFKEGHLKNLNEKVTFEGRTEGSKEASDVGFLGGKHSR